MQSQLIDDQLKIEVKKFWKNRPELKEMNFLDLETTGLSPIIHEILEIGIVKVDQEGNISTFQQLVKPKGIISQENQNIHGISMDMVQNKPTIEDVLPQAISFMGNSDLVGHNVQFDCGFLITQSTVQKLDLAGNGVFDTCLFSRQVAKKTSRHPTNHKLSTLISIYDKSTNPTLAHRALWDSLASLRVFMKLTKLLEDVESFESLFRSKSFVYYLPKLGSADRYSLKGHGMCEKDELILISALEKNQDIMISYHGGSRGDALRPIRPVALLPTQKHMVLHAECLLTQQMRNFKIKLIKSLTYHERNYV